MKEKPFQSRKRTRNSETHQEIKRKKSVQHGDDRVSKSGKQIEGKSFHAQDSCKCKRSCAKNIDVGRQKEIFTQFYQFENWSKKRIFLWSLVKSFEPKPKIIPVTRVKKKLFTHAYYLVDSSGKTHQVCLSFLVKCLQISRDTINTAANKISSNPNAIDRRGTYGGKNKNVSDISLLKAFINKFPRYESHYKSSKSNSTEYLIPSLNIIRMYREYCLLCRAEKRTVLSEWMFRNIFNTKFNLRFGRPKVDTCKTCDQINTKLKCCDATEYGQLKKEKDDHDALVQKYKSMFSETLENAKNGHDNIEVLTFDLQRALEMPRLSTSVAYYKRQLWFYNLGVYDEKRKIGYMYVWPESVASRGAQEIAACLCRHMRERLPPNTQKLILNSDSCYGQNKNIKLALMLKRHLASWHSHLTSIEQRFFIVGHSYNRCDGCFGLIEKQKKITENIFVPSHWINVIRQAKKKEPKFIVIEMETKDFLSSKPIENLIVNRKVSITGEKITWRNFQTIVYDRNSPFVLRVKDYNKNDAPITEISIQKRGVVIRKFVKVKLPLLYPKGRAIDKKKFDDLLEQMNYVPTTYHHFFKTLKFIDNR